MARGASSVWPGVQSHQGQGGSSGSREDRPGAASWHWVSGGCRQPRVPELVPADFPSSRTLDFFWGNHFSGKYQVWTVFDQCPQDVSPGLYQFVCLQAMKPLSQNSSWLRETDMLIATSTVVPIGLLRSHPWVLPSRGTTGAWSTPSPPSWRSPTLCAAPRAGLFSGEETGQRLRCLDLLWDSGSHMS